MFVVLALLGDDIWEKTFILALAVLQLLDGRLPVLDTRWGRAAFVILQLGIVWLVIGYTEGIQSPYFIFLLLPMVSTASRTGLAGTLATSIAAIVSYLSFLL